MKLFEVANATNIIDNVKGVGAVPLNQDVDYFGIAVKMKPSIFLELSHPISRADATSADGLKQHIQSGGKIGSPFLSIDIPTAWRDGNYSKPAKVVGHEGRNRMIAVSELFGETEIEVHLFFSGGLRARDVSNDWKKHLKQCIISEYGKKVLDVF
jgi:hypothetical protein